MIVRLKMQALRDSQPREHLLRLGLGGLATVVAGVIAKMAGPVTGGLFLALPAIFCASATLIEKHERKRKEERGLQGARRGRAAAALEAAGAGWGSMALAVFGLCVWLLAEHGPVLSLSVACVAWFAVAVSMWWLRCFLRITRHTRWTRPAGMASSNRSRA